MLPAQNKVWFMKIIKGQFILLVLLLLSSCSQNHYKVDISKIDYKAKLNRLDIDLFESDPALKPERIDELINNYDNILQLYSYVIEVGEIDTIGWPGSLRTFITDRYNYEIYSIAKELYSDIGDLESNMSDAWRHYIHYFSEAEVPELFTFISGFRNSIIIGESVLGIGLDRYLGSDSKYYPMMGLYNYQVMKMIPEKIVSDCMYAWAFSSWPINENPVKEITLLENMIHEGKLLYFTKCMIPHESDSLLFGFTSDQLQFCQQNEDLMWEYLLEHDMLFTTVPITIKKFVGEAPFTGYFSNESPGRAAVWLAFRIVESFMARNNDVSLGELMSMDDYQAILEGARYSPSRSR